MVGLLVFLLVLHGESSKRLATPRNTKDKKHLQSTLVSVIVSVVLGDARRLLLSPLSTETASITWHHKGSQPQESGVD